MRLMSLGYGSDFIGTLAKVLTGLRKSPQPDGESLVKFIQTAAGVDLTADVKP